MAVWVAPYGTDCPARQNGDGPAIAQVGGECVYFPLYATYLRDLSLNIGLSGRGSAANESAAPGPWPPIVAGEYFKHRNRLVAEFGIENAAFAALAVDIALFQEAVSRRQMPPREEAMANMGQVRERIGGLLLLTELHEFARASDLTAFRSLMESPRAGQLVSVQGEEHLLLLFEQAKEIDFSGTTEGLEIHAALLESVDPDRYWTEVYVDHARRMLAIEALRTTMVDPKTGLPSDSDWQDFREKSWSSTFIKLTDDAPENIALAEIRSYMSGNHALQREFLKMQLNEIRPTAPPDPTTSPDRPQPTPRP